MHARRHSSLPRVVEFNHDLETAAAGLTRSMATCARGSHFTALTIVVESGGNNEVDGGRDVHRGRGPEVLTWPGSVIRQLDVAAAPGREAIDSRMVVVCDFEPGEQERLGVAQAVRSCVAVPLRLQTGPYRVAVTAWSDAPATRELVVQAESVAELLAGPIEREVRGGWRRAARAASAVAEPPVALLGLDDGHVSELASDEHEKPLAFSAVSSCGALAHELNNAVTAILLDTELLGSAALTDGAAASATTQAIVDRLLGSTERVVGLGTLLKMSSGCGGMATELVDLATVAGDTLAVARQTLPPRVGLQVDLCARSLVVRGEERQLAMAMQALVDNALESVGQTGGEVVVALQEAHLLPAAASALGLSDRGHYARFSVTDDGPGMEPDMLQRCIQPFFSSHQARLGLGLSAAHGLAVGLGGALRISSAPDGGTTAELLLPVD